MTTDQSNDDKPRKKKGEPTEAEIAKWVKEHPFRYSNIKVSDDDKERIKDHALTFEQICDFIRDVHTSQYKLSLNWDSKHSCSVVSITGTRFWRDDFNACVTSRGPDLWTAFAMAIHKWDTVISNGGIPKETKSDESILD